MNIEHEGKTYEVLTLDRISEITHAKYDGRFLHAAYDGLVHVQFNEDRTQFMTPFDDRELHLNNIQPLRLVPKEPVTFEATFALVNGFWTRVTCLDDGIAYQGYEQKRFRCVEIVEEQA
jgi:hypothetical protein